MVNMNVNIYVIKFVKHFVKNNNVIFHANMINVGKKLRNVKVINVNFVELTVNLNAHIKNV